MRLKMNGGDLEKLLKSVKGTERDECLIEFKEDRVVTKAADAGGSMMVAALIPEDAMEEYEQGNLQTSDGEENKLGIHVDRLINFIQSSSSNVLFEIDDQTHKITYSQEGAELQTRGIVPDAVEGKTNKVPGMEWSCQFTGDIKWLFDFWDRLDNIVDTSSWMISPRDGAIYVYGERDDTSLSEYQHWEDFDDYNIDWDTARTPSDVGKGSAHTGVSDPSEDHGVDSIFSLDYAKSFNRVRDKATVYLDNHAPIRILFETDNGVKISVILSPRIPSSDSRASLPEDVDQNRGL